jgi:two-component system NtrC family sensor kinase
MQNSKVDQQILVYAEELMAVLPENNSFGIALFSESGDLLFANEAMKSLAPNFSSDSLLHPTFSHLNVPKNTTSESFSGYITIGELGKVNTTIEAKVFRKNGGILIAGGINVASLIEQNKTMHFLNQRVTNLQRQLTQEKAELERTMKELKETQQYESYKQVEGVVAENGNETLAAEISSIRKKNEIDFLMEDISDMASESKVGVERVKTIVEDLRRFSRLDESDIKQIDLIENIRSTVSIAKAEISSKNIHFELICPEKLDIECYPGQLNQAILNVLINAIQAVTEGGQVSITVEQIDEKIIILVKDNGCGIP